MKILKANYKLLYPLLVVLFMCEPMTADAQIWKNLGRKIEKKVEEQASRRAERRIDKAIDKGFDKVEQTADDAVKGSGKAADGKSNAGGAARSSDMSVMSSILSGSGETANIKDLYEFDLAITYELKDKPSAKPVNMSMALGKGEYMGMSTEAQGSPAMFMILDEGQMSTFMLEQQKYMVIGSGVTDQMLAAAAEHVEEEDDSAADVSIRKVGSERILNYACDIYEMTTDDGTVRVWLTQELGLAGNHFLSSFSALMRNNGNMPQMGSQVGGMLLKMEAKDQRGRNTTSMVAIDVNDNGFSFNTTGYSPIGF